jgi:hypothetical protein
MNKSRFDKIGIKQVIRLEWMDRCLSLLLSGMSASEIRKDLIAYLADKKQSGGTGDRGGEAVKMSVNMLSMWYNPKEELLAFRDNLVEYAKGLTHNNWVLIHWAMMVATYPFWYNLAIQVGRVLNLQDAVTSKQVNDRVAEMYGDRETIHRYARYSMRTFVAWGVLMDTDQKGQYKKNEPISVADPYLISLILEALLISTPDHKASLRSLISSPSLFPMCLATDVAKQAIASNSRLMGEQFGDGEMMVGLDVPKF